jgi:hypothetical protein
MTTHFSSPSPTNQTARILAAAQADVRNGNFQGKIVAQKSGDGKLDLCDRNHY